MPECEHCKPDLIENPLTDRTEHVKTHKCDLGHEIPLGGCPEDCPDFKPS